MLVECASFRLLTSGAGAGQNQRYPKDYEMGQEPWKKCRKAPKLLSLGPCEERNTLANMLRFFFCSFGSRECIWMDEARCNLGTEVHDRHGWGRRCQCRKIFQRQNRDENVVAASSNPNCEIVFGLLIYSMRVSVLLRKHTIEHLLCFHFQAQGRTKRSENTARTMKS